LGSEGLNNSAKGKKGRQGSTRESDCAVWTGEGKGSPAKTATGGTETSVGGPVNVDR